MKMHKVVCNIDKMTICLLQPRTFFVPFKKSMQAMKDQYYKLYYDDGDFYLAVEKETDLEENTITTHLYVKDIDNPDTYIYYLGNDEKYRIEMFDYFANNLLRFKMNNHDKTQVTIRGLAMLGINTYKSLKKRTKE